MIRRAKGILSRNDLQQAKRHDFHQRHSARHLINALPAKTLSFTFPALGARHEWITSGGAPMHIFFPHSFKSKWGESGEAKSYSPFTLSSSSHFPFPSFCFLALPRTHCLFRRLEPSSCYSPHCLPWHLWPPLSSHNNLAPLLPLVTPSLAL